MELFGVHFSLGLGAWRLRFVLALDDETIVAHEATPRASRTTNHVHMHTQKAS